MIVFQENHINIKDLTKSWAKQTFQKDEDLQGVEQKLSDHMDSFKDTQIRPKSLADIESLEKEKVRLLVWKEVNWKMKSRSLWLFEGDNNYFFP